MVHHLRTRRREGHHGWRRDVGCWSRSSKITYWRVLRHRRFASPGRPSDHHQFAYRKSADEHDLRCPRARLLHIVRHRLSVSAQFFRASDRKSIRWL